jgi:hypothetical protein
LDRGKKPKKKSKTLTVRQRRTIIRIETHQSPNGDIGEVNMKIETKIIATCCEKEFVGEYEYEVLGKLLNHIRKCHPDILNKINKNARKHAMSRNGCGYWDDGKSPQSGWYKAQPIFREAWRKEALERMLEN